MSFGRPNCAAFVEPVNSKFSVKVHPLILGYGIEKSEFTASFDAQVRRVAMR